MPDPAPFGETFFEASSRAIIPASSLNKPGRGWVESVFTSFTHRFDGCDVLEFSAPELLDLRISAFGFQSPLSRPLVPLVPRSPALQCLLKYCTSRSCFSACCLVANVPRLRRFPSSFFLREYKRYCPLLSFRIMIKKDAPLVSDVASPAGFSGSILEGCLFKAHKTGHRRTEDRQRR